MENLIGWLGSAYMPLKALHVIVTFFWIAGLFIYPRYLVHQASVPVGSPEDLNWRLRTARLRRRMTRSVPIDCLRRESQCLKTSARTASGN